MARSNSVQNDTGDFTCNFEVVEPQISIPVAVFTVISVTIGSSMVSVPQTAYESGIPWALGYNTFNFILSLYSIHLYLKAAQVTGYYSVPRLVYECFGHRSLYFVSILQLLSFGMLSITNFIVFANLLKSFIYEISWVKESAPHVIGNQWFSVIVLAVLLFPFIIRKKIQELRIIGILQVSAIAFFIFLMLLIRITKDDKLERPSISKGDFYFFSFSKPWLSSLSTAFVVFSFQSAFFPIYNSLEIKSYQNGMKFTFFGMLFCFAIYTMVTFVSLYSFGANIQGDMLKNIECVSVWESYLLRAIFMLLMAAHTPFTFFIGKGAAMVIVALLYIRGDKKEQIDRTQILYKDAVDNNRNEEREENGNERENLLEENCSNFLGTHKNMISTFRDITVSSKIISEGFERNFSLAIPFSKLKKTMVITGSALKSNFLNDLLPKWVCHTITILLYAIVVGAACVIQDVATLVKFIGSISNAILNLAFPGIFYFILMRKHKVRVAKWKLGLSFCLFMYGVAMALFLTGVNIWVLIDPPKRINLQERCFE
ncbi:unnamed protein product [Moneuplotes crassus]|uniref:Amino acid transporter transmembrane domain-containing protein n=1 Tax=Euplotes crassus TaxID=5936 RepID=A0AAD1X689_EUPCR|nr:unnamed protein product [Moneuplotes crassus]